MRDAARARARRTPPGSDTVRVSVPSSRLASTQVAPLATGLAAPAASTAMSSASAPLNRDTIPRTGGPGKRWIAA